MDNKGEALQLLEKSFESKSKRTGFPVEVFPLPIQQLIKNAERTVNFNPDYFSAGILSASATAIGNSIKIDNGSYKDKPILWVSIIGGTGTGKTHPLKFTVEPIEDKDNASYKIYEAERTDWEEKGRQGKKPSYNKFILSDFTPEKLGDALQQNEKGVMIFRDELMGWINSWGRYNSGGEQQQYLSLFNGGIFHVDRKHSEPIRVEETNVNILGGMQPDILRGMAKDNRDKDGFLHRFLFIYPQNLRPNLQTLNRIESRHQENYGKLIDNLLSVPDKTLMASPASMTIFIEWQHEKAKECFHDNLERAIQAKMETYVWRLSLVIEMMHQAVDCNYTDELSQDSMEKALILVEYFRENTLRVHDKITMNNPLDSLSAKQREAYEELPYKFKREDIIGWAEDQYKITEVSMDRMLKKDGLFFNSKTHIELKQGQYIKKL